MRTDGEPAARRTRLVVLTAAASLLSLLGGALVLTFGGDAPQPPAALQPILPSTPEPVPASIAPAAPERDSSAMGYDTYDNADTPDTYGTADTADTADVPAAPSVPVLQLPQLPALPAAPTIDWQAVLQPYIQSQINASIAGTAVGPASGALNAAGVAVSDLILFAAYSNDSLLTQLQKAGPAVQSAVAAVPAADLSGLSSAFAAAAAQPPIGVPAPPRLPTPEQAAAALAILPPPPPPPAIGLPPIGLPSITRLFGLPF